MAGSGGSIRQRKADLWEGRYRQDGRQHSVYGKTMREAQDKLRAALRDAGVGIRQSPNKPTVERYLREWLETSVKLKRRPRCSPPTRW
jgi:hypothetical protein